VIGGDPALVDVVALRDLAGVANLRGGGFGAELVGDDRAGGGSQQPQLEPDADVGVQDAVPEPGVEVLRDSQFPSRVAKRASWSFGAAASMRSRSMVTTKVGSITVRSLAPLPLV
jgi:hypothetical protein